MEFIKNILRILQLLWGLLLLALLGNVMANNINGHEGAINYAMFATVLAFLTTLWGLASRFAGGGSGNGYGGFDGGVFGILTFALDILALLFALIAAIVLAAKLRAVNCGGSFAHRSSNWIGFGSHNDEKRCREIQASTVFMWFLAACMIATFVLSLFSGRGLGFGGRRGGSGVSSGPHMSQVRV